MWLVYKYENDEFTDISKEDTYSDALKLIKSCPKVDDDGYIGIEYIG